MDDQKQLFETQPAPWQMDREVDCRVAEVVFSRPPFGPYWYQVPDSLVAQVFPGVRVQVPLGRGQRIMEGYCLAVHHAENLPPNESSINLQRLKPIRSVVAAADPVPPSLLELARWISQRYICPVGNALETIIPPGVRNGSNLRTVHLLHLAEGVRLDDPQLKVTEKQRRLLEIVARFPATLTASQLASDAGCTVAPVNTLRKKGLLQVTTERAESRQYEISQSYRAGNLELNEAQRAALAPVVDCVVADEHQTFLLFGITGSGKTEVYIRAIQQVIEHGRQAIVLVPEISLTPQTRRRFRERFDHVAVLHSNLTATERAWHWRQIAAGKVQVVIGARSAIFAPVPRLGLVVIDEEHDGSFKQDKAPRYHARAVAAWRAQHENVPLILGSATPSLESWHAANQGVIELLELPNRVADRPLPDVATVDLRVEFQERRRRGAISRQLYQAARQALDDGGQVILLLNRRGFSTSVICPSCGFVIQCDDCAIPMTHHRDRRLILCHYCDRERPEPNQCPDCGSSDIRFSGVGTQKLEAEVAARFPGATFARMDTDSMRKPGSHEKVLDQFRGGEIQILLGTQMISKGLDFPNVTLVGVINADTGLHLQDFRAAERTFALVTQVAGRTGRGPRGGRVLVQSFTPEHPAIRAATQHDYRQFATREIHQRAQFGYPPVGKLARVLIRGEHLPLVHAHAESLVVQTKKILAESEEFQASPVKLIGPAPAPIPKLRGKHRFHFLLQAKSNIELTALARRIDGMEVDAESLVHVIDIDPQEMI